MAHFNKLYRALTHTFFMQFRQVQNVSLKLSKLSIPIDFFVYLPMSKVEENNFAKDLMLQPIDAILSFLQQATFTECMR